ncbi:MAG: hypothetical protein KF686_20170 [Ramlibacter sp.]|nr:hypothetical protein [Ramlibacter sp.]
MRLPILALGAFLLSATAQAQTLLVVALDSSESVTLPVRARICEDAVRKAMATLQPGDMAVFVGIDDQPYGRKFSLGTVAIKAANLNPILVKSAHTRAAGEVSTILAAWKQADAKQTRVADAVYWAGEQFNSVQVNGGPPAHKRLLICSDLLEASPLMDMSRAIPPNALQRLRKGALVPVPGLRDTEIWVVGLGAGAGTAHDRNVKLFWTQAFEESGAVVRLMSRGAW